MPKREQKEEAGGGWLKKNIHKWVIAKGNIVSDDIQQKSKSLMNFVVFTKHWKPKYDHT